MVRPTEITAKEGALPVRVLIVEDEKYSRIALGFLLRSHGYRVELADSAEEALRLLDCRDPPDAILVDVELPGMNGLELLRRLRRMAPKVFPVIVSAVDAEQVRAVTNEPVPFLRKPVDVRELLSVLDEGLGAT